MKRRGYQKQKKELVKKLDLPISAMIDQPRVSILGDSDVVVENFSGILQYGATVVRLVTSLGEITVTGENFLLNELEKTSLSISGKIKSVTLGGS